MVLAQRTEGLSASEWPPVVQMSWKEVSMRSPGSPGKTSELLLQLCGEHLPRSWVSCSTRTQASARKRLSCSAIGSVCHSSEERVPHSPLSINTSPPLIM